MTMSIARRLYHWTHMEACLRGAQADLADARLFLKDLDEEGHLKDESREQLFAYAADAGRAIDGLVEAAVMRRLAAEAKLEDVQRDLPDEELKERILQAITSGVTYKYDIGEEVDPDESGRVTALLMALEMDDKVRQLPGQHYERL